MLNVEGFRAVKCFNSDTDWIKNTKFMCKCFHKTEKDSNLPVPSVKS